jgi:hypothetical protein
MKSIIFLAFGAMIMICGCGQKKPDPLAERVAALEQQMLDQSNALAQLNMNFKLASTKASLDDASRFLDQVKLESRMSSVEGAVVTNADKSDFLMQLVIRNMVEDQADVKKHSHTQSKFLPITDSPPRPARPAQPDQSTQNGVPASVYKQIYDDAVADWPSNYEMQQFRIDEQIAAYRKLHPQ